MNNKNAHLTTELFTGKTVPAFVSGHTVFKNPTKVQKVFPAIGMPNYREKANLDKCLTDIKKEGTYVWNFLRTLSESFADCKNKLSLYADSFQYLLSRKEREEKRESTAELFVLIGVIDELQKCSDPNKREVIDEAVKTEDGRIVLRLIKDIPLPSVNGKIKMAHKKGEGLIKAYGKILLACQQYGVVGPVLEQTDAFKVFGKENIPNKEYSLVFSSDGPEGAWDILTMSMRGITSCQRWEGEYPKCLIGSMVSKFVGIMYLTSGVMNDGNDKNGNRANLGTKMMRRCIVRYAIDADEDKPCIVLDKMYPDLDKDILKQFMDSIHNRTGFPVYYAPDPDSKLKHIYMPSESLNEDITGREMSYQDTPLKSKHDLYAIMLNFNRDEVERELKGFNVNLSIYMARKFEDIYGGGVNVVPEVKKLINNIRVNTSFTPLCDRIVATIVAAHPRPQSSDFSHSRVYYRKYLMDLFSNRKSLMANCQTNLNQIVSQNTSRTIESNSFVEYIFSIVIEFTKNEIRRCVN